jgi:hypothetical protein
MPKRKHLSSSKELKRPPDSIGILLNKRYVCVCVCNILQTVLNVLHVLDEILRRNLLIGRHAKNLAQQKQLG